MTLKRRTSGGVLEIFGSLVVQEADDFVAAEIRRVRHRWTPVAVFANQNVVVQESAVATNQGANRSQVITPDRVSELHGMDQPAPARGLITAREHELRISQLHGRRRDRFRMIFPQ